MSVDRREKGKSAEMIDSSKTCARLRLRADEGQGMVEYGLVIAMVAIVVIAALVILGPRIASLFNTASGSL